MGLQDGNRKNSLDENEVQKLKLVEFLTRPYINRAYWFEVYELLRKLAMTSVVAIVASYEENQHAAETYTLVITIFSVMFLMYVQPYKYKDDYQFSLLSLFI